MSGAVACGAAVGGLGERGEVYYAYGFLLSLATIPLIVSPPARLAINLIVPLAFTNPIFVDRDGDGEFTAPGLDALWTRAPDARPFPRRRP